MMGTFVNNLMPLLRNIIPARGRKPYTGRDDKICPIGDY